MSGTVPPDRQGRWRTQRGRESRGPNRAPAHPMMPPPDIPVELELETEEDDMTPQKDPSGGSGGIGGPKSPPAAPKTPPPPNDPPPAPEK
ncbi:hypothetical protein ACFVX9_17800 [Kitasatospora sp. NPDC058243]|uniref:hypothetical protein n=1 Tax=Kitasatospora sp. NPDC058243 TaxID=3346397 RepID=UPI0036DE0E55